MKTEGEMKGREVYVGWGLEVGERGGEWRRKGERKGEGRKRKGSGRRKGERKVEERGARGKGRGEKTIV